MKFTAGDVVLLKDLHKKLNLSQSSLPTSLGSLPTRLNFIGLLISYEEIQMVSWQKEVIMVLTDGGIETLKISMWLNHDNPLGIRFTQKDEILGRIIYLKNVCIKSFDFTSSTELQFYGEMNPPRPEMHTILFPIISGSSFAHFETTGRPFQVNAEMSLIPKQLMGKRAVCLFPLLPCDHAALKQSIETMRIYVTCVAKNIQFGTAINALQEFINIQNSKPAFGEVPLNSTQMTITKLRRRFKNWLLSYEQTIDWLRRTRAKRMNA